jgi:ribosome modulation factor
MLDISGFVPTATASIATPETDAALAERERSAGAAAKIQGQPRSACPWTGGLTREWWLQGWDMATDPAATVAKAFPPGGPLLGNTY